MSTPFKRVSFHTIGCKLNFSETSTISRDFLAHGYIGVDLADKPDIVVLNTCSVTENADKDCRKFIRKAKRFSPGAKIIVIGCYAQLRSEVVAAIPGVNAVLGTQEKFKILDYLDSIDLSQVLVEKSKIESLTRFFPSYSMHERIRAFLKVQDGCDYPCTYCTIPKARGKSRNDTISNTVKIAEEIGRTNTREIVLTGVNIGNFGHNQNESFSDLLKALNRIKTLDRIRISSIEPNLITDEIIDFMAVTEKIVPHFHIPLQSGSDKILKNMRRRYTTHDYTRQIEKIKKRVPDVCIGGDIIVGFPGESESDFLNTHEFIRSVDLNYLHVFSYSSRPGTEAQNMSGQVDVMEKKRRSQILHILSDKIRTRFHEKYLGQIRPVLFESVSQGKVQGHTPNYILVEIEESPNLINEIRPVKLVANHGGKMTGELVKAT